MPTSYGYIEQSDDMREMPIDQEELIAEMEAKGRRRIQEAYESGLP